MIRIYAGVLISSILFGCAAKTKRDKNLEIVIESPISYKWDLQEEVFTVSFMSRPDTIIKFHLSAEEQKRIIDRYYKLRIDEINDVDTTTGTILIKDECSIMPKFYTIIHVKTKSYTQNIQIDDECDDFYLSNFREAARIKKFIQFIMGILKSKPEIKNAPTSDILYD